MPNYVFGDKPETILYASAKSNARQVNRVLLGSILEVLSIDGDWLEVDSVGKGTSGWVRKEDVRNTPILKMFFVDVGQGDGAIVESPEGIMLIDGGPNSNFFKFMKHRYRLILKSGRKVKIKAMVVSHPDYDHYNGLTSILKDSRFEVDTIYHNGLIRYDDDNLPAGTDFDLGKLRRKTVLGKSKLVLTDTFDSLVKAQTLVDSGNLGVQKFLASRSRC